MALAALLDVGVPEPLVQEGLRSLDLPGKLVVSKVRKNGFAATRIQVETTPAQKHRHLHHILEMIDRAALTPGAKAMARAMFEKLGEAEAASHGIPVQKVHFHEVGAVDSIFDFVGVAIALDSLGLERITARSVPTGRGWVDCDHGRLPVPAPAVAHLLAGVPLAESTIEAELTTPTGAAILATFVKEFVESPPLRISRIGHGAGTRDFPNQPNLLRVFVGVGEGASAADQEDLVWQLETNLDDVSPEYIGYCRDLLFEAGALDVITYAAQMKKGRPGSVLVILCGDAERPAMETILFRETGTFGIRRHRVHRTKLERSPLEVSTPWGAVRGKVGRRAGHQIFTPEFEDCAKIARASNVPLADVYRAVIRAFEDRPSST